MNPDLERRVRNARDVVSLLLVVVGGCLPPSLRSFSSSSSLPHCNALNANNKAMFFVHALFSLGRNFKALNDVSTAFSTSPSISLVSSSITTIISSFFSSSSSVKKFASSTHAATPNAISIESNTLENVLISKEKRYAKAMAANRNLASVADFPAIFKAAVNMDVAKCGRSRESLRLYCVFEAIFFKSHNVDANVLCSSS